MSILILLGQNELRRRMAKPMRGELRARANCILFIDAAKLPGGS
jgi:hypothetical protein